MAKEKSTKSEKTNIRRIKATDATPKTAAKKTSTVAKKATKKIQPKTKMTKKKVVRDIDAPSRNPFKALANYFRGAWRELKQVRWPTRASTWSMTLAVLLFSAIFVVFILLLDMGFSALFEQLLK